MLRNKLHLGEIFRKSCSNPILYAKILRQHMVSYAVMAFCELQLSKLNLVLKFQCHILDSVTYIVCHVKVLVPVWKVQLIITGFSVYFCPSGEKKKKKCRGMKTYQYLLNTVQTPCSGWVPASLFLLSSVLFSKESSQCLMKFLVS